ncbi:t-SNARE [Naematelia encephala]|uniref:t-SNARE n=1 Tax=Naematelia encephala TaxID=71784 RepID=A0A1Y2BIW8_9TREE|nr:t-SNARE [Naematelia encephala]
MDNSPTALFENYDEDFKQLVASLKGKLEGDVKTLKGEQKKAALKKVSEELDEAEEIIAQMEVELPSMPLSIRQTYTTRLRTSKEALDKVKKTLRDVRQESARSELLSGPGYPNRDDPYSDDPDPSAFSARTRLLQGTETLQDGSRRLENAQRIALETEDVGADILRNLRGQREQIEHTRDTLVQADSSIDRAAGTLKKMIFKMYQQKFVSAGIIAILVVLILIVLWSKLR